LLSSGELLALLALSLVQLAPEDDVLLAAEQAGAVKLGTRDDTSALIIVDAVERAALEPARDRLWRSDRSRPPPRRASTTALASSPPRLHHHG
jgi:hypothetical protein